MDATLIAAFVAPEPESDLTASHEHPGFVETVWAPIRELVTRLGPMAVPILLLVAVAVTFICSVFSPWALLFGLIPAGAALIAWFWPKTPGPSPEPQIT